MVSLQPGLCLALKNGFLASDSGPSYPTNFRVFLCNPSIGPSASQMSAEEAMRMVEQAALGKLSRDDINTLTSMKP